MKLEIRRAQNSDALNIAEMVNRAYRGETGRKGWTTEADLLAGVRTDETRVREQISGVHQAMLIAESSDDALSEDVVLEGCVHLQRKNETTAYLGMLTTDSSRQAKGTGSSLLIAGERFAKSEWGTLRMEMTVITSRTELIAWYVRRGYVVTNEKRPFPNDPRFGVPLVEGLEFVVLEKSL